MVPPRTKPNRPDGFPLYAHNCGQWAKWIKGKDRYFGPWGDPDAALANYLSTKDSFASPTGPVHSPSKLAPNPKPAKPYAGYPLYSHANGQWAKYIKGRVYYFGPWSDPDGALDEFNRVQTDLYAGRQPLPKDGSVTLKELCNLFLDFKEAKLAKGHNKPDTYKEYRRTCIRICKALGDGTQIGTLTHSHFEQLAAWLAKEYPHPTTQRNEIVRCHVVFNYAFNARLVSSPLNIKIALARPPEKLIRKSKNEKRKAGLTMYRPPEILAILNAAQPDPYMHAAVHLGINAALGPRDIVELQWRDLDLESGFMDFPRPKTYIQRAAVLWPETVAALRRWQSVSPVSDFTFCGQKGQQLGQGSNATPIPHKFDKVLKAAGIDWMREIYLDDAGNEAERWVKTASRGFYAFRHAFATSASGCKDQIAVNLVMGHADNSISANYRAELDMGRLRAVSDWVHRWLFSATPSPQ